MRLLIHLVSGERFEHSIQEPSFTIGRSRKCEVVIPHEGVSRQHVRIEVDKGDVYVTDLGSTNGVLIDGERIPAGQRVLYQTFRALAFGAVESLQIEFETSEASRVMENPLAKYKAAPVQNEFTTVTRVAPLEERKALAAASTASAGKKSKKAKVSKKESNEKFRMIAINLVVISLLCYVVYYFFTKEPEVEYKTPKKMKSTSSDSYL